MTSCLNNMTSCLKNMTSCLNNIISCLNNMTSFSNSGFIFGQYYLMFGQYDFIFEQYDFMFGQCGADVASVQFECSLWCSLWCSFMETAPRISCVIFRFHCNSLCFVAKLQNVVVQFVVQFECSLGAV